MAQWPPKYATVQSPNELHHLSPCTAYTYFNHVQAHCFDQDGGLRVRSNPPLRHDRSYIMYKWNVSSTDRLYPLDSHGDAHPSPDTQRGHASAQATPLQVVQEGDEYTCTGSTDRVAERQCSPTDVHLKLKKMRKLYFQKSIFVYY